MRCSTALLAVGAMALLAAPARTASTVAQSRRRMRHHRTPGGAQGKISGVDARVDVAAVARARRTRREPRATVEATTGATFELAASFDAGVWGLATLGDRAVLATGTGVDGSVYVARPASEGYPGGGARGPFNVTASRGLHANFDPSAYAASGFLAKPHVAGEDAAVEDGDRAAAAADDLPSLAVLVAGFAGSVVVLDGGADPMRAPASAWHVSASAPACAGCSVKGVAALPQGGVGFAVAVQRAGGVSAVAVYTGAAGEDPVHFVDVTGLPGDITDVAVGVGGEAASLMYALVGSDVYYFTLPASVTSADAAAAAAAASPAATAATHLAAVPDVHNGRPSTIGAIDGAVLVGSFSGQIVSISTAPGTLGQVSLVAAANSVWALTALAVDPDGPTIFAAARDPLEVSAFANGTGAVPDHHLYIVHPPADPSPFPPPSPVPSVHVSPYPSSSPPHGNGSSPTPTGSPGDLAPSGDHSLFGRHKWAEWVLVIVITVVVAGIVFAIGMATRPQREPQTVNPREAPLLGEQGPRI